jgi:HAD superfamily hydrolase (TIGR01459 family)
MVTRLSRFDDLFDHYSTMFCDVWGVVHNGVELYPGVTDALAAFKRAGGTTILVTNAPRPAERVAEQLNGFGLGSEHFDHVATSGDATRTLLARYGGQSLFHLGPDRDLSIYDQLNIELSPVAEANAISCTGFFDDTTEVPDDYRNDFTDYIGRGLTMVCSNPDILIDRGGVKVWCAGALAQLYAELGGKVELAGKPHAPIYQLASTLLEQIAGRPVSKQDILAVGDGMKTDVAGANGFGLDCLLITDGIHAHEMGRPGEPVAELVESRLTDDGLTARYYLPSLSSGRAA